MDLPIGVSAMEADQHLPGQRLGEYLFLKHLNDLGIHPVFVNDPKRLQSSSIPMNCAAVFIWREGSTLKPLSTSLLRFFGFEMSERYAATINANWDFYDEQEHQRVTSEDGSVPPFTVSKTISDDCFEISYASNTKCTILGGRDLVRVNSNESNPRVATRCFYLFVKLPVYAILLVWEMLLLVGKNAGAMTNYLKLFGIGFVINVRELLKINDKPNDIVDYVKVACSGGIIVLLWKCGMSKRTSNIASRISGGVILYSVVHLLWAVFSYLPRPYCLCASSICGGFMLRATAYEAFMKIKF